MSDLKKTIIRGGLETLYFSAAHVLMRPFVAGVGAILTLHHVRPPRSDRFQPNRLLEVRPSFLEDVIRYLRRCRLDLVSLDEMYRRLTEQDFSRRFVCVTIDDGYRDTLQWAYPLLKKHRGSILRLHPDQLSRTASANCGGWRSRPSSPATSASAF